MELPELLARNDGVLDTSTALDYLTPDELRWKVRSGRWQKPARGIVVSHSGPLTEIQAMRVALLWAGPRSVIGGLTAAWLNGFKGFNDIRYCSRCERGSRGHWSMRHSGCRPIAGRWRSWRRECSSDWYG